jgi:hypothetical protein
MKSVLSGLAALPLLAGVALAGQPVQLNDKQMDKVTAGWDAQFTETSNTSITNVSVYKTPNTVPIDGAYLVIINKEFSVSSIMK